MKPPKGCQHPFQPEKQQQQPAWTFKSCQQGLRGVILSSKLNSTVPSPSALHAEHPAYAMPSYSAMHPSSEPCHAAVTHAK